MSQAESYPSRYCPSCNRFVDGLFRPGPGGRPDAGCPRCGSLERQRFLALLLGCLEPTLEPIGTLLDIAPSPLVSAMLARLEPDLHLRTDIGADPRLVDVHSSLTELPLREDSVDFLICYHVLEHIPDDRTAMRELARVMAPGALGLVQVPWRPDVDTAEDPSASESERLRRFGQADHVRWYGRDFEQRLLDSGLRVRRLTPRMLVGDRTCEFLRLNPEEMVWLISPDGDPTLFLGRLGEPTSLVRMLEDMLTRLGKERMQRDRARTRVRRLRERIAQQEQESARLHGAGRKLFAPLLVGTARRGVGRLRSATRRVRALSRFR